MMCGRQIVRLILDYFTADRNLKQMWQLEDLFSLQYAGDKATGAFRFKWHKIVSCLQCEVTKEQLRKFLRKKLQGSHALKEDLAHFDREEFKAGSTEHTYEYLLECMDRHLRRYGQDRNQHQFEKNSRQKLKH